MKILVTGGNGYIAKSLVKNFSNKYDVTSITRKDFDLSNSVDAFNWFKDKSFDVVIHTAIVGGSRLQSDGSDVIQQNLMMYYNLVQNQKCFDKLISFGSGAEIFQTHTPYGISKKIIADSILENDNFYNIRVFAVFDENELDRRFIKSNIIRYIKKEPIYIHSNRLMDFFYMKDLCSLVEYYIENENLPKEVNASYKEKYTLENIAEIINDLNYDSVSVIIEDDIDFDFYAGESNLPIPCIGLHKGIEETYKWLS